MTNPDHKTLGLTTTELLAHAQARGCTVSPDQLKRWRLRGIVPRPAQHWPPGVKGSVSIWPAGSDEHLMAVCMLAKRFRRLDDLLLATWWNGWPVAPSALTQALTARLDQLPLHMADHEATDEDRYNAVEQLTARVDITRIRGPLRQSLRGVGTSQEDRLSFITTLLGIGAGIAPPLEPVDVGRDERELTDIVASGLGFGGFARQLTEVDDPTTPDDLVQGLANFASQISPMVQHAQAVLAASGMHELDAARDQARSLAKIQTITEAGVLVEPDGGVGFMGQFLGTDDPDSWVFMLANLLWLRSQFPDHVAEVAASIEQGAAPALVLNAIPELKELLHSVDGDQAALAELVKSRPDLQEQVTAYLDEHPDVATMIQSID